MNEQQVRALIQQELMKSNQQSRFNLNVNPRQTHSGLDGAPINTSNLQQGLKTFGRVTFTEVKNYRFEVNFRPSLVTFYGTPYHTSGGVITVAAVSAAGTGYSSGDILGVVGGSNGKVTVTGVNGSGGITSLSLTNAGFGYSAGVTTTTGGLGSGATVNLTVNSGATIDVHTFVFGQAALGQNLAFQPVSNSSVRVGGKFEIVQGSTMFRASGSGSTSSFAGTQDENHIIDVENSGIVARATVSSYGTNFFIVTVDSLASGWTIIGNYFVS